MKKYLLGFTLLAFAVVVYAQLKTDSLPVVKETGKVSREIPPLPPVPPVPPVPPKAPLPPLPPPPPIPSIAGDEFFEVNEQGCLDVPEPPPPPEAPAPPPPPGITVRI